MLTLPPMGEKKKIGVASCSAPLSVGCDSRLLWPRRISSMKLALDRVPDLHNRLISPLPLRSSSPCRGRPAREVQQKDIHFLLIAPHLANTAVMRENEEQKGGVTFMARPQQMAFLFHFFHVLSERPKADRLLC